MADSISPFVGSNPNFTRQFNIETVGGDQRARLAEMLRSNALNAPQGQMVSGWYVPPSWSQNLAQLANTAVGVLGGQALDEERAKKTAEALKRFEGVEEPVPMQNIPGVSGQGAAMAEGQSRPEGAPMQSQGVMMQQPQTRMRPLTQDEQDMALLNLAQINPQVGQIYGTLLGTRTTRAERAAEKAEQRAFTAAENEKNRQAREEMIRLAASMRPGTPEPLIAVMGKDGNAQLVPRSQAVGMTPFNAQTAGTGAGTSTGRQREATEAVDIVMQAAPLVRQATSSGVGAAVDWAGGLIGKSSTSADKAAELKVLGGMLVSKMPKMSGPQSDKDVLLYKEMAGRIGDPTVPASQKESALQTIYNLNAKYAGLPEQTLSFDGKSIMQGYAPQGTGVIGGDLANQAAQILQQRRKAGQ